MGPGGLHSRHWLRRGRRRPIGKRCLRPHLPSSSVCSVCLRISRRVCTHHRGRRRGGGERSSEKSRLTCLARIRGHPHPSTPPPTRDATLRTSAHVIVRDVISTTNERRGRNLYFATAYSLRAMKIGMHLLLVRTCEHLILSRGLHHARDATGVRFISSSWFLLFL